VFHINRTLKPDKYLDERHKSGWIAADDMGSTHSFPVERKAGNA
jgi:hypothetical protein